MKEAIERRSPPLQKAPSPAMIRKRMPGAEPSRVIASASSTTSCGPSALRVSGQVQGDGRHATARFDADHQCLQTHESAALRGEVAARELRACRANPRQSVRRANLGQNASTPCDTGDLLSVLGGGTYLVRNRNLD